MKRVIKLHTFGDNIFELDRQIMPTQLSDNAFDVTLNQIR